MAGRLYRMAKVVSANPSSWGIVDAKEISGFRRVAKLTDLYSIAECILSSSYGDGVTDGADAIGQIWYVAETNADYKLINWGNRKSASGWSKLTYGGDVSVPVKDVLVNDTTVVSGGIAKIKIDLAPYMKSVDAGKTFIPLAEKGVRNGVATLDVDGFIPLKQLGHLDMTVFTVVETLPTADIENKVYLVKSSTATDQNNYAEYIYTGNRQSTYDASKWEKLGEVSAKTDLSNYYNKSDVDGLLSTNANNHISSTTLKISSRGMTDHGTYKLPTLDILLTKQDNTIMHGTSVAIPVVDNTTAGLMLPGDKTKLDGIEKGANNYIHPIRDDKNNLDIEGLYKIKVDANGHVQKNTTVTKADIVALGIPGELTKITINTALSNTIYSLIGSNTDNELFNLADAVRIVTQDGVTSVVAGNGLGIFGGIAERAKADKDGKEISTTYVKKSDNKYYTTDNLTALTEEEINKILA